MWIYECHSWPEFTWDINSLALKLADIRYRQGRLLGRMENLGFDLRKEASLNIITNDVVKSSAIEGEELNPNEVRSSIARRLGIDIGGLIPVGRDIQELKARGIFIQNPSGGRSTSYRLLENAEI